MAASGPGSLVYGIDVGMANSKIVVGLPDGSVQPVEDPDAPAGCYALPTSVCLLPDGRVSVGYQAEQDKLDWPGGYLEKFKREFSKKALLPFGDGRAHEVHTVAGHVLRHLRGLAQAQYGGTPETVAIAVPAGWESSTRDKMLRAAELAGFDRDAVLLVDEPVAAAEWAVTAHCAPSRVDPPRTLLVYDLGGATFDCALAFGDRGGRYRIADLDEVPDVGGADFDQAVLDLVRSRFRAEVDALFADSAALAARFRLQDTCRDLKHRLSTASPVSEPLTELGSGAWFELSRAQFEGRIARAVDQTVTCCDRLRQKLGLEWEGIEAVVLTGGSSRIPLVRASLEKNVAPDRVFTVSAPELAVAYGATLLARRQCDGEPAARRVPPGSAPAERATASAAWGGGPAGPAGPVSSAGGPVSSAGGPVSSAGGPAGGRSPVPWRGDREPIGTPTVSPRMVGHDLPVPPPVSEAARGAVAALVGWAASALPLAWWRWPGWFAVAASLVTVLVAVVLTTCAARGRSRDTAPRLTALGSTAALLLALAATTAHTARALTGTPLDGLLAGWALVCAGMALWLRHRGAVLMQATGPHTTGLRELDTWYRSVAEVMGRRASFVDDPEMAGLLRPLGRVRGTRVFQFDPDRLADPDHPFEYAAAAGNRVVLVHVATPAGPQPRLRTAANAWVARLQQVLRHPALRDLPVLAGPVRVSVVIMVPGEPTTPYPVPVPGEPLRVAAGHLAEAVADLLDGGTDQIIVPIVAELLAASRGRTP